MRRGLVQKGRIGGRRIAAAQELAEAISQDRQREHGREKHHITRKQRYDCRNPHEPQRPRSEEHTSELQSLMRISYAVFCLKKKKTSTNRNLYKHDTIKQQRYKQHVQQIESR